MRLTHTSSVIALLWLLTVPFVAAAGRDLGEIARQQPWSMLCHIRDRFGLGMRTQLRMPWPTK
jgi:hypothetical protein